MNNTHLELERMVYDKDVSKAVAIMRVNGQLVEGSSENYLRIHPEYSNLVGKDKRNAAIFAFVEEIKKTLNYN